jgi:hypothetical protein
MDWFSKHVVVILGAVIVSMIWMNTKFNDIDKRFNEIEKDIVMIKTTLILKNIMPKELAQNDQKQGG